MADRSDVAAHAAVVAAAVLFGSTFLVVKDAVEEVAPVPFLATRFLIGAAVLAPLAARRPRRPGWLRAGALCGVALLAGYLFQTVGLQHTSGSVSAFITYLLVVFVPPLGFLLFRTPVTRSALAGVALATIGLVLLTGGVSRLGAGEALTLGCAVAFAFHVLALDRLAPQHDPLVLNAVQLGLTGAVCLPWGLAAGGYGTFTPATLAAAAFLGVFASAVALGLQAWAQSRLPAVRVSLLLLIEPVSAAFLGLATGDDLGLAGVLGALVILAGIVVSETAVLDRRRRAPVHEAPLAPL